MVEKGKHKHRLIIKDVMNNHILHKTGCSKFLKTLTLIYQTRRRRIMQRHNIYIYRRDNLEYHKVSSGLMLGLLILLPDMKML
jgi:hypothetical protein